LKGAVRIELTLEDDRLFEPGQQVTVAGTRERETEIEYFRRQHGHCVVKFRGIDHISEVEEFIGAEIRIPTGRLRPLKEGWFYTFQLKGCGVFTVSGEYLGTVTDVLDLGGSEVLKVDRDNEETLIPFAMEYLKKIDLDQQRIEVDLPEGLRELNK
jgi:16S rRNA processing protein RimM